MGKVGKKHKQALEAFDRSNLYNVQEAVSIVRKIAKANFDETVDVSVKLNLKRGQSLRDTFVLPHQTSSEKKILVFAKGEKAEEAKQAGAAYVGDVEYIEKIKGGWLDFDVVISTPDMMKEVGKLGPVLGRRGLMPNPKTKTVTTNIAATIQELQKGRMEMRADKTGIVHVSVGKLSMDENQLVENISSVISEIKLKRPSDAKGDFLLSIAVSSTMGPGVRIGIPA